MRTNTAGLLLLVIALLALSGFLTGNLDRWIAYLFDPTRPGITGASSSGGPAPTGKPAVSTPGTGPGMATAASLVTLAQTTSRQSA